MAKLQSPATVSEMLILLNHATKLPDALLRLIISFLSNGGWKYNIPYKNRPRPIIKPSYEHKRRYLGLGLGPGKRFRHYLAVMDPFNRVTGSVNYNLSKYWHPVDSIWEEEQDLGPSFTSQGAYDFSPSIVQELREFFNPDAE